MLHAFYQETPTFHMLCAISRKPSQSRKRGMRLSPIHIPYYEDSTQVMRALTTLYEWASQTGPNPDSKYRSASPQKKHESKTKKKKYLCPGRHESFIVSAWPNVSTPQVHTATDRERDLEAKRVDDEDSVLDTRARLFYRLMFGYLSCVQFRFCSIHA